MKTGCGLMVNPTAHRKRPKPAFPAAVAAMALNMKKVIMLSVWPQTAESYTTAGWSATSVAGASARALSSGKGRRDRDGNRL